jgi:hypothetical protein
VSFSSISADDAETLALERLRRAPHHLVEAYRPLFQLGTKHRYADEQH